MTDFAEALEQLWPNGDQKVAGLRAGIIETAPAVFAKYRIDTALQLAHVMAQISHECGAGHDVVENLNYSPERMMQVWPSRFPSFASTEPYSHSPRALANKVYNGRMGNRPGTDDGWNFRGRGGSQTTGREGYERVREQTGLDVVANPDILIEPKHFLECAVADFIRCGCISFAKADDILNVTKQLNGGTVGLAARKNWLLKWKAQNVAVPVEKPVPTQPAPKPPRSRPAAPTLGPMPKSGLGPRSISSKSGFWESILNILLSVFKKGK